MKLRIQGNSIRLRLKQGEVDRLARQGFVEEQTLLGGPSPFVYRLRTSPAAERLTARLIGSCLEVEAPVRAVDVWAASDQTAVEAEPMPEGVGLRVVIEKDFACLVPRSGDADTDCFPNPAGPCA